MDNKNTDLQQEQEALYTNIPEVETQNNVKFDSLITYSDFENINQNEQPTVQAQIEETEKSINAKRYTDIAQINADIINNIENNDIEEYFPSAVIDRSDNNDILEALHRLADERDANAQNMLGVCYFMGIDVAPDTKKAMEYFNDAAEQGNPVAQRNFAIVLENIPNRNMDRVIELYEKAAGSGDAYAMNNLGVCYLTGDGVKTDVKQAVKYFDKAVKQGDDYAMVNLADCYSIGNGVKRNDKKAFELYKKAADMGNIDGLRNTADCYLNGVGTKQDFQAAVKLYKTAADKGDATALDTFNKLQEKLSPQKHSDMTDTVKAMKKASLDTMFDMSRQASENTSAEKTEDKTHDKAEKTQQGDIGR